MTGERATLPVLPEGIVGILATEGDDGPHAIPVSALHRDGDRVLLALAPGRGSLARLRARPAVALALIGPKFSVTAHGEAAVVADPLPGAQHVVALEVRVARVEDTLGGHTLIHRGISWGWRDHEAAERHRVTLAALRALVEEGG